LNITNAAAVLRCCDSSVGLRIDQTKIVHCYVCYLYVSLSTGIAGELDRELTIHIFSNSPTEDGRCKGAAGSNPREKDWYENQGPVTRSLTIFANEINTFLGGGVTKRHNARASRYASTYVNNASYLFKTST
jgi:hypothetical protein